MAIKFDLYKTPVPSNLSKKGSKHARIVGGRTVETTELSKYIQKHCTLTAADIKGTLAALSEVIAEKLKQGDRIHLEGVGYFQMTLGCEKTSNPENICAGNVHFKSVKFRADSFLKEEMNTEVSFVRSEEKQHSEKLSDAAIDKKLISFFKDAQCLTRLRFERLCGFTKPMALKHLKRLVEDGKLENVGTPHNPTYMLVAKGL